MPKIRFTDRGVAQLRNEGKQVDYWDTSNSSFGIRVSQRGRKTWVARYRTKGAYKRHKIGHYPNISLADARNEARKVLAKVYEGEDPSVEAKVRKQENSITVGDLAHAYIEKYAKVRKKSWKQDEAILKLHVLPQLGGLHPKSVERVHIQNILDLLLKDKKPYQANRVFQIIRKMFNWGLGTYVDISPCYGMSLPAQEKPRHRDLQPADVRKLWGVLDNQKYNKYGKPLLFTPSIALALKILLFTGQRVSEVTQAHKSEFNREDGIWTLPADRTKNGRLHRLPLTPCVWSYVDKAFSLSGDSFWLFPSPVIARDGTPAGMKPIGPTSLNHALSKISKSCDVQNLRPHDFRELMATQMASQGVSELHIDTILNHVRGTVIARHYNRYMYEKEKLEAFDIWEKRLNQIVAAQN